MALPPLVEHPHRTQKYGAAIAAVCRACNWFTEEPNAVVEAQTHHDETGHIVQATERVSRLYTWKLPCGCNSNNHLPTCPLRRWRVGDPTRSDLPPGTSQVRGGHK